MAEKSQHKSPSDHNQQVRSRANKERNIKREAKRQADAQLKKTQREVLKEHDAPGVTLPATAAIRNLRMWKRQQKAKAMAGTAGMAPVNHRLDFTVAARLAGKAISVNQLHETIKIVEKMVVARPTRSVSKKGAA